MVLQPEKKAPDFEIEAYDAATGEIVKVKLDDFKGK